MKTNERQELLNDLLPAGAAPEIESILAALREDRAARASRRAAGSILAATLATLVAAVIATRPGAGVTANLAESTPARSGASAIIAAKGTPAFRRITDEELQASIDQPSAIVTLPDGRKSLLVLVPPPANWRSQRSRQ